jgi:hypothetical protein
MLLKGGEIWFCFGLSSRFLHVWDLGLVRVVVGLVAEVEAERFALVSGWDGRIVDQNWVSLWQMGSRMAGKWFGMCGFGGCEAGGRRYDVDSMGDVGRGVAGGAIARGGGEC